MSGPMRYCAPVFLFLAFLNVSPGQSASPSDSSKNIAGQLPANVVKMLEVQEAWDAGFKNPSGPRLRFVKFDEFSRPDGHFTRYRVYTEGAKEGTPYIFAVLKIGTLPENVQILSSTAFVNRKGLLLTRKPTQDEENRVTVGEGVEFDVGIQAANGEPLRFLLRSRDNKVMIPGTLVPFPIESLDKGCRLAALLAAPEGNAVLIYADGFPPDSEVEVESNSAGEHMESKHQIDAKGHGMFVELPYVLGKEAGELKDTLSSKNCAVSVAVPWGKGSYHKH